MENSKANNNGTMNTLEISKLVGYTNLIMQLIDDMCGYIYKGQGDKIFDNLNEFINGLDFILSKANYISEDINMNNVEEILINIEKAISIKDYVLLADILIYELSPLLQNWIELLKK